MKNIYLQEKPYKVYVDGKYNRSSYDLHKVLEEIDSEIKPRENKLDVEIRIDNIKIWESKVIKTINI